MRNLRSLPPVCYTIHPQWKDWGKIPGPSCGLRLNSLTTSSQAPAHWKARATTCVQFCWKSPKQKKKIHHIPKLLNVFIHHSPAALPHSPEGHRDLLSTNKIGLIPITTLNSSLLSFSPFISLSTKTQETQRKSGTQNIQPRTNPMLLCCPLQAPPSFFVCSLAEKQINGFRCWGSALFCSPSKWN